MSKDYRRLAKAVDIISVIFILLFLGMLILGAFLTANASAHQAPTGWSYPTRCCSTMDCRVVNTPESKVKIIQVEGGYKISTTGEFVPYNDMKIKDSPDGYWHWCSHGGKDTTKTICLFRPPMSY